MIFLSTNSGLGVIELRTFAEALQGILVAINTLNLDEENSNLLEEISNQGNINLQNYVLTIERMLELFQTEHSRILQSIADSSNAETEERKLNFLRENGINLEEATLESISINNNSTTEVENRREEILRRLKSIFSNKKLYMMLLSILFASQTKLLFVCHLVLYLI